jgi:hypothetical protein
MATRNCCSFSFLLSLYNKQKHAKIPKKVNAQDNCIKKKIRLPDCTPFVPYIAMIGVHTIATNGQKKSQTLAEG